MRTFQQDYNDALNGNKTEVLERRKVKLDSLRKQLATSRGYSRRCLADRIALLENEYECIAEGV